jgi:Domain of unknown function (DUF4160)
MPTVLREGPYAFLFYSSDRNEPRHIHVKRDREVAKFWLEPVSLASNEGYAEHEVRAIERRVVKHQQLFVSAWDEYFST